MYKYDSSEIIKKMWSDKIIRDFEKRGALYNLFGYPKAIPKKMPRIKMVINKIMLKILKIGIFDDSIYEYAHGKGWFYE